MKLNIEIEMNGILQSIYGQMHSQNIQYLAPTIVYREYPDLEKHQIRLREFKNGYRNDDEKIAGNLYSWIHQSYSVLWEVNLKANEIIIIRKTNEKLAQRFSTLLKIKKDSACSSVFELSATMALFEFIWLSKTENNSLDNNSKLTREYMFTKAYSLIEPNLENVKIFNRFRRMFG